jgi:hypothetical protein
MTFPVNGNQQGAGQGTQQQGQQQGSPNGQQQAPQDGQQQGAPAPGSLIAEAAAAQQPSDPQGAQQGAGQQAPQNQGSQIGQQQQGAPLDVAAELRRMQDTFASEIDRRVNSVVGTLRREFQQVGQQQQGQGQQGGQQAPAQQQWQPPAVSGPDPNDVREARMAARETLTATFPFIHTAERELAAELMAAQINQQMLRGDGTPDQIGTRAAAAVAERLTALRGVYEAATVNSLRQRGQIAQPAGQGGVGGLPVHTAGVGAVGGNTGGSANPVNAYQAGQNRAAQILPGRTLAGRQTQQSQQ